MRPDLPRLPDLIVLGDSHSNALVAGCLAHGLNVEMLRFSGNFWHSGQVRFNRQYGVWVRNSPPNQALVTDLYKRLGDRSFLSPDLPILGSFGFHLGRMVPRFAMNGHETDGPRFLANPDAQFASSALLSAFVAALRVDHFTTAQRLSRFGTLTMVAPPDVFGPSNYQSFRHEIVKQLRDAGTKVYDPNPDLSPTGQAILPDYITADGVHGNDAYGEKVIGMMLKRGLIKKRAA